MIWERFRQRIETIPLLATLIAPAIGGCLYALSNIGYGMWPLAFVFITPLWISLELIKRNNLGLSLCSGFIFGFTIYLLGYHWLVSLAGEFIQSKYSAGYILWLINGIWYSTGFAIYSRLYVALRNRALSIWIAGVIPFVILEWLQPNIFPSYAGASLVNNPTLVQIADLGGPLFLTAFVLSVNMYLFQYALSLSHKNKGLTRKPHIPLVKAIVSVLLVSIYGLTSIQSSISDPQTNKLTIGSIQSNLVRLPKDELSIKSHKTHVNLSNDLLETHDIDLLLWPESAYVRAIRRTLPIDAQSIRQDITKPILFGGMSVWQLGGQRAHANSVFLANEKGVIDQAYDKNLLIPFAEYLPFSELLGKVNFYQKHVEDLFPFAQTFVPGQNQDPITFGDTRIQTPICFEMIHPEYIRDSVIASNPHLIVTLANDGWFKGSQAPLIHLNIARLRAIEHRLWVVRSTNSGYSAVIDPMGQITSITELDQSTSLVADVFPSTSLTVYSQYGNWVAWLGSAQVLLCFLLSSNNRRLHSRPVFERASKT